MNKSNSSMMRCCCGCICALICIFSAVVLVLWFIVRPNTMIFDVTDATLFNKNNNTNLLLNVTARNPSNIAGVFYDYIEAHAFCREDNDVIGFDSSQNNLEPFFQSRKTTILLSLVFKVDQQLLQQPLVDMKKGTSSSGFYYDISVRLHMKVRFKVGILKKRSIVTFRCSLHVPLDNNNGPTHDRFYITECDTGYEFY
ncbi:hypothetical protein RIF29_40180 [Crotalaria pallida]|uniref:Late embryogenesis abundant protein LEA-2 subgroup domain-containing protein n=1 Tax=Crotalaria pallida TaxID=3830 RepID=A0AAN9HN81_CROPI